MPHQARIKPSIDGRWLWEVVYQPTGAHSRPDIQATGTADNRLAATKAAKDALRAFTTPWEVI